MLNSNQHFMRPKRIASSNWANGPFSPPCLRETCRRWLLTDTLTTIYYATSTLLGWAVRLFSQIKRYFGIVTFPIFKHWLGKFQCIFLPSLFTTRTCWKPVASVLQPYPTNNPIKARRCLAYLPNALAAEILLSQDSTRLINYNHYLHFELWLQETYTHMTTK